MKRIVFLIIFSFVVSLSALSQVREISFEESHQALVDGFKKEFEGAGRIITKSDYFEGGKRSASNTSAKEFLNPNKSRTLTVSIKGKKVERFEVINIDYVFYCRDNLAQWVKSERWCGKSAYYSSGSNTEEESAKYTVQETTLNSQKAKLYHQYIVYKNEKSQTFYDYKFWLSEDGNILRRELLQGSLKPKTISYKLIETREYNAKNIKIEAPVK